MGVRVGVHGGVDESFSPNYRQSSINWTLSHMCVAVGMTDLDSNCLILVLHWT